MFYYFFLKYKYECNITNKKKLLKFEWAVILLLMISSITLFILAMLNKFNYIFWISLVTFVIDTVWIIWYGKKKEKANLDDRINSYKRERIGSLVDLLKKQDFNSYSIEGIEWLIICCNEKIVTNYAVPFLSSIKSTIFPICTLAYGVVIANMNQAMIVQVTIALILLIILLAVLGQQLFIPIFASITYPDNNKYIRLKEDLEYIKTQYSDIPDKSLLLVKS